MMQKARAVYTNGNWTVEIDTKGNRDVETRFMNACHRHLQKRTFPTSYWYLDESRGRGNVLRVVCYGPDAKADTRDAAVILSAATNMDIRKGGLHEQGKPGEV